MDAPRATTAAAPPAAGFTSAQATELSAVICDDRLARRRSISGLLSRSGFTVAGEVDSFASLPELVGSTRPTVAVVTLSLVGLSGLESIRQLRRDVPESQVVLLSAFTGLMPAAVQAGARALVPEDDPRTLLGVLTAISETRRGAGRARAVSGTRSAPAPPAA